MITMQSNTLLSPDKRHVSREPGRLRLWLRRHRTSLLVLVPLLVVVGLISGLNFTAYPGLVNDDEGTYGAQAWAVLFRGELAHYTYWYDHPPLGWLQIAGYSWLTNGFGRSEHAVLMVREVMLIANVVSSALIYLVVRRLQFHRVFAVLAVLLFAISPLAVYYHRMVFLDNLQVMWMLAAMAFALSPRRSLNSIVSAGLCLAAATLSKETGGIVLPVVIWLLLQNHPQNRRWLALGTFLFTYVGACSSYILYAVLKGELIPGEGHVSLLDALWWQMFGRESSGSILEDGTAGNGLVTFWLSLDSWLLLVAVALVPLGFVFRRTRAITFGYVIQVALLFKSGYVPQAYAVALVPFSALIVASVVGSLWERRVFRVDQDLPQRRRIGMRVRGALGIVVIICTLGSFAFMAAPQWQENLDTALTQDSVSSYAQTLDWVEENVPEDAQIIVDDNLWLDLTQRGYDNVDWLYKVDLDPAVQEENFSNGWRDADYVAMNNLPRSLIDTLPTVADAIDHGEIVFESGNEDVGYTVYRVLK